MQQQQTTTTIPLNEYEMASIKIHIKYMQIIDEKIKNSISQVIKKIYENNEDDKLDNVIDIKSNEEKTRYIILEVFNFSKAISVDVIYDNIMNGCNPKPNSIWFNPKEHTPTLQFHYRRNLMNVNKPVDDKYHEIFVRNAKELQIKSEDQYEQKLENNDLEMVYEILSKLLEKFACNLNSTDVIVFDIGQENFHLRINNITDNLNVVNLYLTFRRKLSHVIKDLAISFENHGLYFDIRTSQYYLENDADLGKRKRIVITDDLNNGINKKRTLF